MALNYCRVTALIKNVNQQVSGVQATEKLSGRIFQLQTRTVVNATGVFADEVLKMDNPVMKRTIRPSQGVHLVIDETFLPGQTAMMIPKTDDGRVLFAIPWHNKVVLGTTDTPVEQAVFEPRPLQEEIDFILRTAGTYLTRKPEPRHVLSVFAGLRPLLARRTRALLFNAPASKEIAPEVAAIMAAELHMSAGWEKSETTAYGMLVLNYLCH